MLFPYTRVIFLRYCNIASSSYSLFHTRVPAIEKCLLSVSVGARGYVKTDGLGRSWSFTNDVAASIAVKCADLSPLTATFIVNGRMMQNTNNEGDFLWPFQTIRTKIYAINDSENPSSGTGLLGRMRGTAMQRVDG